MEIEDPPVASQSTLSELNSLNLILIYELKLENGYLELQCSVLSAACWNDAIATFLVKFSQEEVLKALPVSFLLAVWSAFQIYVLFCYPFIII